MAEQKQMPDEIDRSFADQVSEFLYRAGRSRADYVVTPEGSISFSDWLLNALSKRDTALRRATGAEG